MIASDWKKGECSFIFRFILVISDVYFEGNVRKSAVFIGARRLKTCEMGKTRAMDAVANKHCAYINTTKINTIRCVYEHRLLCLINTDFVFN